MSTLEHYNNHLSYFYEWISGDFEKKSESFRNLLKANGIQTNKSLTAIDLGAGHGIQSIAMEKLGFQVLAVDFSQRLLDRLRERSTTVKTLNADIRKIESWNKSNHTLIVCAGDTLTHLGSLEEVKDLTSQCIHYLSYNGWLVFSFRDYTTTPVDSLKVIPVKSNDQQIFTCVLSYLKDKVLVTDIVHEKNQGQWVQRVSSYHKVKISEEFVLQLLDRTNLQIILQENVNNVITIIAKKIPD